MQEKALEFEKVRGASRMAEIGASADAAWNTSAMEAFKEAVAGQGRPSGVKWADALSTSVRPIITYWLIALYCAGCQSSCLCGGTKCWCGLDEAATRSKPDPLRKM